MSFLEWNSFYVFTWESTFVLFQDVTDVSGQTFSPEPGNEGEPKEEEEERVEAEEKDEDDKEEEEEEEEEPAPKPDPPSVDAENLKDEEAPSQEGGRVTSPTADEGQPRDKPSSPPAAAAAADLESNEVNGEDLQYQKEVRSFSPSFCW